MFKVGDVVKVIKPDSTIASLGLWVIAKVETDAHLYGWFRITPLDISIHSNMSFGETLLYKEDQLVVLTTKLEKIIYGVS
jgi:hypothetical protein